MKNNPKKKDIKIKKRGRPPKDKTLQEQKKRCGIGTWIYDTTKKPPFRIEQPDSIPERIDKDYIRECSNYYGLGYCIHEFIPSSKIDDKKLAKMWEECRKQIVEIIRYIYDK